MSSATRRSEATSLLRTSCCAAAMRPPRGPRPRAAAGAASRHGAGTALLHSVRATQCSVQRARSMQCRVASACNAMQCAMRSATRPRLCSVQRHTVRRAAPSGQHPCSAVQHTASSTRRPGRRARLTRAGWPARRGSRRRAIAPRRAKQRWRAAGWALASGAAGSVLWHAVGG